ncbi:Holliday junction resolvase RuvX [Patescibacteria group bacterium]
MSVKDKNILGVDYGEKKVGLAVTSDDHAFVFGRGILTPKSVQDCIEQIREVCKKESITTIVVGFPLNKDGTLGSSARAVEQFSRQLQKDLDIPVVLEDERMSSVLAQRLAQEADRQSAYDDDDEDAAKVILQSYIEKVSHITSEQA